MLLDEELRKHFVYTDFKVLRAALFTTSIPRLTNEVSGTTDSVVIEDQQVGTYQFLLKFKNEEIC